MINSYRLIILNVLPSHLELCVAQIKRWLSGRSLLTFLEVDVNERDCYYHPSKSPPLWLCQDSNHTVQSNESPQCWPQFTKGTYLRDSKFWQRFQSLNQEFQPRSPAAFLNFASGQIIATAISTPQTSGTTRLAISKVVCHLLQIYGIIWLTHLSAYIESKKYRLQILFPFLGFAVTMVTTFFSRLTSHRSTFTRL